jgi:hypothetical protein
MVVCKILVTGAFVEDVVAAMYDGGLSIGLTKVGVFICLGLPKSGSVRFFEDFAEL